MKKILFLTFCILMLFLSACNNLENNENNDDNEETPDITDSINDNLYEDLYDELFSLDNKITITFDIDDTELKKIEDDYQNYSSKGEKSEIYRYAKSVTFTINDKSYKVEHIGIRMKGNTSRRSFINNESKMYNLVHFRISFKQTFDSDDVDINNNKVYPNKMNWQEENRKALKNRKVFGLEAIEMRYNKELDATYTREIYTSELFKEFNIYAQKMNNAEIKINSKTSGSLGVYRFSEVVDEIFINRYFDENDQGGDLYKVGFGNHGGGTFTQTENDAFGIEDLYYTPTYDLKTNKKTSNHEAIKGLISFLQTGDINKDFEKYFDVDYYATFQAILFLMGDPDSLRYNSNNFYIYFNKDNKAFLIPYDYDRTFGAKATWNPMDATVNLSPLDFVNCNYQETDNLLIIRTLRENTRIKEAYLNKIVEIKNSEFFSFNTFKNYFNKLYPHYNNSIKATYQLVDFNLKMSINEGSELSGNENYSVNLYFQNKRYLP